MKNYLILIIFIIFSYKTYSQDKSTSNRFINSYDSGIQLGTGGGYVGIMGRSNQ